MRQQLINFDAKVAPPKSEGSNLVGWLIRVAPTTAVCLDIVHGDDRDEVVKYLEVKCDGKFFVGWVVTQRDEHPFKAIHDGRATWYGDVRAAAHGIA